MIYAFGQFEAGTLKSCSDISDAGRAEQWEVHSPAPSRSMLILADPSCLVEAVKSGCVQVAEILLAVPLLPQWA